MILSVKTRRRIPRVVSGRLAERLQFALGQFTGRIRRVDAFFEDLNGPRGGVDKACRIVVRLFDGGELVADVVDVDWQTAVDRATTRIGQSVRRELARRRMIARAADSLPLERRGSRLW